MSITGELAGLGSGGLFGEDYRAHYIDFDLYGTVNFNDHVGAQVGYRSFNVYYLIKKDEGNLDLKGLYFGGALSLFRRAARPQSRSLAASPLRRSAASACALISDDLHPTRRGSDRRGSLDRRPTDGSPTTT